MMRKWILAMSILAMNSVMIGCDGQMGKTEIPKNPAPHPDDNPKPSRGGAKSKNMPSDSQ